MADILIGNVRGPQGVQGDPATIEVGTVSTTAYGNPAQVTNSGTAEEAVLDFVIPAGRPGEETTSMSALTLDTITAQTAAFPVPAVGERGAVVFGKIIKFFTDTVASLANKLNVADVVNNLTSTATNKPLSAAQGKALNDALVSLTQTVGAKANIIHNSINANAGYNYEIPSGAIALIAVAHPYATASSTTFASCGLYMTISGYTADTSVKAILASDGVTVAKISNTQVRVQCSKAAYVTIFYA